MKTYLYELHDFYCYGLFAAGRFKTDDKAVAHGATLRPEGSYTQVKVYVIEDDAVRMVARITHKGVDSINEHSYRYWTE